MSEHHHHHHKKDGASKFKERSLMSIHHRRIFVKVLKAVLMTLAVIMCIAVLLAYTIG